MRRMLLLAVALLGCGDGFTRADALPNVYRRCYPPRACQRFECVSRSWWPPGECAEWEEDGHCYPCPPGVP